MTAIEAAAAAAAAEEGGDVFSYRAFYAGYVDPHRVPPFGPGCRGEGNGWRSTPVCYICELRCDMFDDHGARFCDMCYQDHHLACDVDPSSAKVAEECNLMLAEDRPTGGGFEFRYANSSNDYYRSHRDSYMVDKWRPSLKSMSCDLAKNETWLCSSCQQKQAASNTGLCYSRSNIEF